MWHVHHKILLHPMPWLLLAMSHVWSVQERISQEVTLFWNCESKTMCLLPAGISYYEWCLTRLFAAVWLLQMLDSHCLSNQKNCALNTSFIFNARFVLPHIVILPLLCNRDQVFGTICQIGHLCNPLPKVQWNRFITSRLDTAHVLSC